MRLLTESFLALTKGNPSWSSVIGTSPTLHPESPSLNPNPHQVTPILGILDFLQSLIALAFIVLPGAWPAQFLGLEECALQSLAEAWGSGLSVAFSSLAFQGLGFLGRLGPDYDWEFKIDRVLAFLVDWLGAFCILNPEP